MNHATRSTRQQLLDVATEQFRSVGYHHTDTNRIARAAGFAPQTFYRHFKDKRAIFLAVYQQWSQSLLAAIEGRDAAAAVRSIISHHRKWGVFRASLIALQASDEEVATARLNERKQQLEALRQTTGASAEQLLFAMLCCERIADSIAMSEPKAFGVSNKALTQILIDTLEPIFSAARAETSTEGKNG